MKKAAIAVGILAVLAALLSPLSLAMVAVVFGAAAAAQDSCVSLAGNFGALGGPVRLPVTGTYRVTSEHGMRVNPGNISHGVYRMHWGLDIAPATSEIVAAAAGVVQSVPSTLEGGNEIWIDHGGGLVTGYKHLSSRSVAAGDRVWAGRQIGVEGETGNVDGAHLHFEVKVSGVNVDPRVWLTQQGVAVPLAGATAAAPPAVELDPGFGGLNPGAAGGLSAAGPVALGPIAEGGETKPVVPGLPTQVGAYQGDQITNAALVIKAGQAMGLDAKTITIAVMTAMGESSLKNLDYGDAAGPDSRGLFQQRAVGWGSLEDRMNPTTAATNFYSALTAVPDYLALEPTIAAHRTQRNADPHHYQPYWAPAVQMVATLTADATLLDSLQLNGAVAGCDGSLGAAGLPAGDGSGAAIVAAATQQLGVPYSWGGGTTTGPSLGVYQTGSLNGTHTVGFDCSGLVLFAVYTATGVQLPHSAEQQGQDPRGTVVARDWAQLQPGDVVSFSEDGSGAAGSFGHVGIYVGAGKMIHAPRPGDVVKIVQLQGSSYYEPMAWSIRRYASASG